MNFKSLIFLLFIVFLGNRCFAQDSISDTHSSINETLAAKQQKVETYYAFPVILKFDTLFYVKTSIGGASAEQRARSISQRIRNFGKKFNESKDSIYTRKGLDFVDVMFNENLAFTITKADAEAENKTLDALAIDTQQLLSKTLKEHKYHLTAEEWLIRIGYTLAAFLVLVLILWGIKYVFRKLDYRLSKLDRKLLKKRNNLFKYFIPKNTKNIFVFIAKSVRFVIIVILLFVYLPLLFSFLPWTQGLVDTFYGYLERPIMFLINGFINFLPDLFFIIVIFYVTRYIVRVMHDMFDDIEEEKLKFKGFPKDWASPTRKLFSVVFYAFALIMVFPHLPGSDSPAFKGVSLFLGVLFSLGSTSAVANVVAGIVITYMRPFQIGDRVQILDTIGDVVEKTLLVTRIRTSKNEDITIPNATIIGNHLINYSANARDLGLILHTTITLGYDLPWKDAETYLLRAARATKLLQSNPKPFVLQKSLDDNYVTYELNVYTKQAAKTPLIMSELNKNILDVFDAAGLEILSPKYVASRDGNMSTVPSQKGIDLRNPLEKIADHLTGKNQKMKITTTATKKGDAEEEKPKKTREKPKSKSSDKKKEPKSKDVPKNEDEKKK